ncbi:MAG: VacB/RNase II family 3'-5' exoribonuclease [Epsilonproteobacteria bacterium]|nr:VacB/RNase II family 3'-5' exoribonuclease [Campylobacterota bacterium]
MKQFMTQLTKGIRRSDIPKFYRDLVDYLIAIKALKGNKELKLTKDYIVGVIDINKKGVGFITPHNKKKDLLIEPHNLNGASKGDFVIAKRIYTKNARPQAKVILLLQKAFESIVAYLSYEPEPVLRNIKTEQIVQTKIKKKQLKKLPKNAVFKLDAYTYEITEVLGVLDDANVDEKISLGLYNKTEQFSPQAIKEARSFGEYVEKSLYNREDFTHLDFCTIDPATAKDHDDAIYFDTKERMLYVGIADVSEYVYLDGAIDKEAKQRGFSIYFPHKSIPMLPRELSENICSLKENEDRLALIFKIKFDKSYNVVSEELVEGIIRSKRKFSYEQIDEYLDGKKPTSKIDKQILKWLHPLHQITTHLKQKRLKTALEFFSDEITMELENGEIKSVKVSKETPSHALIEDCMLLANKAAANMIDFGIFRVHDKPKKKDIKELLNSLLAFGIEVKEGDDVIKIYKEIQKQADALNIRHHIDKILIRSQQQAKYDAFNSGHFALGFEKYTHFTSPIRRYSDLTLHRLLKSILHQNQKFRDYILRGIEALVVKISELEREAMKVEWDFYDRKFARWANKHIGTTLQAVVIDTKSPPIAKIEQEIPQARVFLGRSERVTLLQHINVTITSANIATTKIKGNVN